MKNKQTGVFSTPVFIAFICGFLYNKYINKAAGVNSRPTEKTVGATIGRPRAADRRPYSRRDHHDFP